MNAPRICHSMSADSQIWILMKHCIDFVYNFLANIVALVFHTVPIQISVFREKKYRLLTLLTPTVGQKQNKNENLNSISFTGAKRTTR